MLLGFILGLVAGVTIMCILQINNTGIQDDDEKEIIERIRRFN